MNVYKSNQTFEYNGKTYNKVNITSQWNRIGLSYNNFYNEYDMPEGAYSYNEFITSLLEIYNKFISDNNLAITITTAMTVNSDIINQINFSDGDIMLVAVENGLQNVFPFVCPIIYTHDKSFEISGKNIYIHKNNFDNIWLNDLFFTKSDIYNIKYPNSYLGFNVNDNTSKYYICNGTFNTYGLLVYIIVAIINTNDYATVLHGGEMDRYDISLNGNKLQVKYPFKNWCYTYVDGCIDDHIGSYEIKPYNQFNLCSNNIIKIEMEHHTIMSLKDNKFNYHQKQDLMFCDGNGNIRNLNAISDGYSKIYNYTNLVKVNQLYNTDLFRAYFASIDVNINFINPNIVDNSKVYCNILVDDKLIYHYEKIINGNNYHSDKIYIPCRYYGQSAHKLTIFTNANQCNYVITEWSF